jgi:flagellar capping protein FliD
MAISTNLISGLSSGLDWRSIIDQLIAIDHRRVDLVADKKSDYESQLAEWKNVNTMLLSLKTASGALSTESAFNVYTSGTTSSAETTSPALYNIKVNNLAQSEKISSTNYTATDTALELEGDILVSGKVVNIVSTDTLADVKDKINSVNTGSDPSNVTASIVSQGTDNYHLILTSDKTGEDGLSVLEGAYYSGGANGDNILEEMGFISGSTTIKTATSDGAKSDLFDSSSGAIKTLLGLTSAPGSTTVKIGGLDVSIDLSSAAESLTTIAQKIDALAGISAEVVSETVSGETKYRIDISGTTSFEESVAGNGNVLQTLGILEGIYGTVNEVHTGNVNYKSGGGAIEDATTWANIFTGALRGDVANTELDSDPISASTLWDDIDTGGASNDIELGDKIYVSGKQHDGTVVSETYNIPDPSTNTLEGFLTQLKTWFGGSDKVDVYFDSSGRLIVEDLQSGNSQLEVAVEPESTETALKFNTVSSNPFGNNITDGTDTITISGTKHDGSTITTTNFTINTADALNKATTGFLVTIEDLYGGDTKVEAYISDGTDGNTVGQIVLKDLEAGESQITLTLICNNNDGGTLNFGEISMVTEGRDMQVAAGEDAEIVVDNVTITNSSNTITDVIAGATLNLVGEDSETTVTLKVERDLASIKSKIEETQNRWAAFFSGTAHSRPSSQSLSIRSRERLPGHPATITSWRLSGLP